MDLSFIPLHDSVCGVRVCVCAYFCTTVHDMSRKARDEELKRRVSEGERERENESHMWKRHVVRNLKKQGAGCVYICLGFVLLFPRISIILSTVCHKRIGLVPVHVFLPMFVCEPALKVQRECEKGEKERARARVPKPKRDRDKHILDVISYFHYFFLYFHYSLLRQIRREARA